MFSSTKYLTYIYKIIFQLINSNKTFIYLNKFPPLLPYLFKTFSLHNLTTLLTFSLKIQLPISIISLKLHLQKLLNKSLKYTIKNFKTIIRNLPLFHFNTLTFLISQKYHKFLILLKKLILTIKN